MRAISLEKLKELGASVSEVKKPAPAPKDPLVEAVENFPAQLAEAMASLPAPVTAPRPMGSWIIDVKRDGAGLMSGMTAKFHETK